MDKRKFLDAALIILFLLTMSFYFLPRILHEIFGVLMAAAVFAHVFINRQKIFSMFKVKRGKFIFNRTFHNDFNDGNFFVQLHFP